MKNTIYLTLDGTIFKIIARIRYGNGMRDILESTTGRWVQSESLVARFTLDHAPIWIKDWNQVKDAVRTLREQGYGGYTDYRVYAKWDQTGGDVYFDGLKLVPAINAMYCGGLQTEYIGIYTVKGKDYVR